MMRILELIPAANMVHENGQTVCKCAKCGVNYQFDSGVVARLEHEVNECVVDENGNRTLKRKVGLYVYHNLECFTAFMDPEGSA